MNEEEKNASIDYILSQGVRKPQTAVELMVEMVRAMRFRYIFWDTGYSLFFAALTLALVLFLFTITAPYFRYSASVIVAPLVFLLMAVFAETSERASGLYELKQTSRYTIWQISGLRTMCYSVIGIVFTAGVTGKAAGNAYEFFTLLPLCLSALFICATLSLVIMRFSRGKWGNAIYSIVWVIMNIALPVLLGEKWEAILSGVPIVLSAFMAMVGALLLACQISKMLSEGTNYAVA